MRRRCQRGRRCSSCGPARRRALRRSVGYTPSLVSSAASSARRRRRGAHPANNSTRRQAKRPSKVSFCDGAGPQLRQMTRSSLSTQLRRGKAWLCLVRKSLVRSFRVKLRGKKNEFVLCGIRNPFQDRGAVGRVQRLPLRMAQMKRKTLRFRQVSREPLVQNPPRLRHGPPQSFVGDLESDDVKP